MINVTIQQKCYARLLSAGRKTIEQVPENDRVNTYAYGVKHYDYDMALVEEAYVEQVREVISQIV